jgi:hypothetical protein
MIIQLDATQETLYLDGGWSYDALLCDLNDQLDAAGIREPVAVIAADGMVCLFWLTGERRWL